MVNRYVYISCPVSCNTFNKNMSLFERSDGPSPVNMFPFTPDTSALWIAFTVNSIVVRALTLLRVSVLHGWRFTYYCTMIWCVSVVLVSQLLPFSYSHPLAHQPESVLLSPMSVSHVCLSACLYVCQSLCPPVRPSICNAFVRAIPWDRFYLGSPNWVYRLTLNQFIKHYGDPKIRMFAVCNNLALPQV